MIKFDKVFLPDEGGPIMINISDEDDSNGKYVCSKLLE